MNVKRRPFIRAMSSISDVSAGTDGCNDSDSNLEPSQTFYSASAPASAEFTSTSSPNLGNIGGESRIRRLSLERFVAEIRDPSDVRVSPMRAPTRTISAKVLSNLGKSARSLLTPPVKGTSGAKKHCRGSEKKAPKMPMRKASFIDERCATSSFCGP